MTQNTPGRRGLRFALVLLLAGGIPLAATAGGTAETKAVKPVYEQTFESDDGGFTGRSSAEKVSLDGIPGHGGKSALNIKGRKASWNGPMRDMSNVFKAGRSYLISFYARYDEGPETMGLNVSLQKSAEGTGDTYETIGGGVMLRGDWVKIEVEYEVPKDSTVFGRKLYMETPYKAPEAMKPGELVDFAIDDLTITRLPDAPPKVIAKTIPALKSQFPATFKLGTAILPEHLVSTNIHNDLLRHFNTLVYGNATKQDAIQPQEGKFRWTDADAFVKWGEANGHSLRYHTLLWHNQVPSWFFKDATDPSKPASKELLLARLKTHIQTVVSRYKGKFYTYDVVNEVIEGDGTLRNSPYYKIVGSDEYIEMAFRWAHEADPDAVLTINDYNIEYPGAKQDGFYNLVKSLLDRGVPIGAVGLQSHFSVGYPQVADVKAAIDRFSALGVDVQVTELDLSIYENSGEQKKKATREVLLDQAKKYADYFQMFTAQHQAGKLSTVLVWGMSDDETWLDNFPVVGRTDYPLFFGKDLGPKPAYWAIVDPSQMPVAIQKIDAYRVEAVPGGAEDPAWGLTSPRTLKYADGTVQGWFKTLWTPAGVEVLVRAFDTAADAADGVTIWLDPKNAKSAQYPADAVTVKVPRAKAAANDAQGYWLRASVAVSVKTGLAVGFDVALTDGTRTTAWNDRTLLQNRGSDNWGTLTMKLVPKMADVPQGSPKIDGTAEALWAKAAVLPIDLESSGNAETGSTVKLLWDEKNLYALFEIKDKILNDKAKNAYEQDSVELFLDQNNAKSPVYEADDGQYRVSFRNLQTFNGGQVEGFASVARLFAGGYRIEMAIPLYAVTGEAGLLLGFDAQINEADASASRAGIRNWADSSNNGYRNTAGWGTIRLVPAN